MNSRTFWIALVSCVLVPVGVLAQRYETSVMVPMSDGVRLYADIVMPYEPGEHDAWPLILARTPYTDLDAEQGMISEALDLIVSLGFATMIQHTRGAGLSEGGGLPFFHDRADGQETLDWVLDQPWSDGRVMLVGASALGIVEYLMAPGADPGMISQVNLIATPDLFEAVFQGGVFRKDDVESWTQWVGEAGSLEQMAGHRDCDAFWDPVRIGGGGPDVRAVALHLGGWWDLFVEGNIQGFREYGRSSDPWIARRQYLILGPWSHHGLGEARVGQLTYPDNAKYDLQTAIVGWLVWSFFGESDVVESWPRVQYYTMGDVDDPEAPGNEWRGADDWPPFPVDPGPVFLAPGGALVPEAPVDADGVAIPFNPKNPSPTVGGRNLVRSVGPRNLATVESRADAAVFTGDVLEMPVDVTGPVTARLWVATSGNDADVAVRLADVYPDGRSMLVLDGIQRLSRRGGCLAAVPVTPDEFTEVEVELGNVSYVFNVGHRMRLVVTGSNYPRFEVNPFLHGDPPPADPTITLTIATGGDRPSALVLPVPAPVEPVPEAVEPVEVVEVVEPVPDVIEPDAADAAEVDVGLDEGGVGDGSANDDVPVDSAAQDVAAQDGVGDAGPSPDPGASADTEGRDGLEECAGSDVTRPDASGPDLGGGEGRPSSGGCAAAAGGSRKGPAGPLILALLLGLARLPARRRWA